MKRDDFIAKYSAGYFGDNASLEKKIADLSGFAYDQQYGNEELVTDNKALVWGDSGKTFNIATDAKTFTLPLITADNVGKMKFRFRNTGADGAVALTISPNALDGINGSVVAGAGANADATTADGLLSKASGVVDKNLVNTKATANIGDWIELQAVSLTKWFITGGVGIWASEG